MAGFLELIPVEYPPFLESVAHSASEEIVQGRQDESPTYPVLLKTVRHLWGNLWLPTYLPQGFDFERAEVTDSIREHPNLIFPNDQPTDGEYGHIIMTVHQAERYQHEYVPMETQVYSKSVVLGDREGMLIRGGWVVELAEDGAVAYLGWNSNHTRRLVVKDPTHDQVVSIAVTPASLITEDELVRIAESLNLSQMHRLSLPWLFGR